MPERLHRLDVGTIGSKPCEVKLNQILMELDNFRITSPVMRRYNQIKSGFKNLQVLVAIDRSFCISMTKLFFEEQIRQFDPERRLPDTVYTHARCCFTALYRDAISKLKRKGRPGMDQDDPQQTSLEGR
jgi:hypothetical protein